MMQKQQLTKMLQSKRLIAVTAVFVILAVLPVIVSDNFFLTILTLITIFSIYAASWNFLANSGQGSLGHAIFLGVGGFAAAIIGSSIASSMANMLGTAQLSIGALSVQFK